MFTGTLGDQRNRVPLVSELPCHLDTVTTGPGRPPDLATEVRPSKRRAGPGGDHQGTRARFGVESTTQLAKLGAQEGRHRYRADTGPRLRIWPDDYRPRGFLG